MGLITFEDSLDAIFELVKNQLKTASEVSNHPFRFLTLATYSEDGPHARYVVLRAIDDDMGCYFFSDNRASKVEQIAQDGKVALLFYNSEEKIQVRISGIAKQVTDSKLIASFWQNINGDGRKAYTSQKAPGEEIESPEMGHTWHDPLEQEYFSVIKVAPQFMDVLQLDGMRHIRAQFKSKEKEWKKLWVCP